MPKKIRKIYWACSSCEFEYETKEDAAACEQKHIDDANEKELRKKFPIYHEKDCKHKKHCVRCGERLLEYEYVFDGHRAEIGELLFNAPRATIFQGRYCLPCTEITRSKITKLLSEGCEVVFKAILKGV